MAVSKHPALGHVALDPNVRRLGAQGRRVPFGLMINSTLIGWASYPHDRHG